MKKIIITILMGLQCTLWSENINISQVDSASLMLNQTIDLYVQVTDDNGKHISGLTPTDFIINETNGSKSQDSLEIKQFKEGINLETGINFLLIIDNSGSMYRTIDNKLTNAVKDMRITIAKEAIKNFVNSTINIKDTVSLASFNTNFTLHSTDVKNEGLDILDTIIMPGPENKTELYSSLIESTNVFSKKRGRKVVIVLSDGENVPYGKGRKIVTYNQVIDEFQKDGISIFGINFAGDADKNLISISSETGGYIFDANNQNELTKIYSGIKNQIVTEYLITYKATMLPGESRLTTVNFKDNKPISRKYYSSTILGKPLDSLNILFILLPIFSLCAMYFLWKKKFDKLNSSPNIEILEPAPGVKVSAQTVALDNKITIIGGNNSADLTITGDAEVVNNHAMIVYDESEKHFTLVSNEEVLVNNNLTKDRKLESGDVINIAGTTIIFDDEVMEKE